MLSFLIAIGMTGQSEAASAPTRVRHIEPFLHARSIPPTTIRRLKLTDYPGRWFSEADFPEDVSVTSPTEIVATVTVGPDNVVEGCTAEAKNPVAPRKLIDVTCPLIQRKAKFLHAVGADGSPIRDTAKMTLLFTTKTNGWVDWGLSPPPPIRTPSRREAEPKKKDAFTISTSSLPEAVTGKPVAYLSLDERGKVMQGEVSTSSGSDRSDATICAHLSAIQFKPKIGLDGRPAPEPRYYASVTLK